MQFDRATISRPTSARLGAASADACGGPGGVLAAPWRAAGGAWWAGGRWRPLAGWVLPKNEIFLVLYRANLSIQGGSADKKLPISNLGQR